MCGIAGFTHRTGVPDPDRIDEAIASLIHRGPDQHGAYRSNFISLGATRLKIIDLALGDQPMVSGDNDTVLVFNGEIYNHAELRKELEPLGHRFVSRSDTETVLHAFAEWDTECFQRLRGMFAIALWSESGKRLVLARDRMGIKPLYICRRNGDILFGSELKAILVHPEVRRELSIMGLNCFLSLNYVPCPWTLVDGIEKLPPAHFLEWRGGEVRKERYWSLDFHEDQRWTLDSAKEKLDSLLQESVREHLASDVPLGIWLSGGLDSSTILHYAMQATTARLKTFSISFSGRSFDEADPARRVAKHYETEHQQFDVSPALCLSDAIEEFAYYSDEPSADSGALPMWYLSRLTHRQATVALSGGGADELFAGYLTYRADQWASALRRVPEPIRRGALGLLRCWPVSDEKIGIEYKLKRLFEGSFMPAERAHLYWNGTFSESQKREFFGVADALYLQNFLRNLCPRRQRPAGLNQFLSIDHNCYLPDDILYKIDRMSMAHSLEVRPPFLDHRIAEFAASLPQRFKIRGSRQKFLLRELMKQKLPSFILRRSKIGLDIPTHDWLRGALRPLLLEALTVDAIAETGLFRVDAIQKMIEDHMQRRANMGFHLWGLMILFLWIKKWKIQSRSFAELKREQLEKAPMFM